MLKWKIPHTVLERQTLCLNAYKKRKLKVRMMNWSSLKKKGDIFIICVLSQ